MNDCPWYGVLQYFENAPRFARETPPQQPPDRVYLDLIAYGRAQLDAAFAHGRKPAIQAAARFLLDCHQLLQRWTERHASEVEAAAPPYPDWEIERDACLAIFNAHPGILAEFNRRVEEIRESRKQAA